MAIARPPVLEPAVAVPSCNNVIPENEMGDIRTLQAGSAAAVPRVPVSLVDRGGGHIRIQWRDRVGSGDPRRGSHRRPKAQPHSYQAAEGGAECPRNPMSVHHGLQSHGCDRAHSLSQHECNM